MSSKVYQLPKITTHSLLTLRASSFPFGQAGIQTRKKLQNALKRVQAFIRTRDTNAVLAIIAVPMLFAVPAVQALNATHNSPLSPAAAQVPIQISGNTFRLKGINIGNDQSSTDNQPYLAAQNASDLAYLKGKVSRVRIALAYGLDKNDVNNLKRLAIEAKKDGFHVQFGITAGADPDARTYYNQWLSTDVINTAEWAQANHIDEFAIGNEEDWYNMTLGAFTVKTPQEIRSDVRNEVAKVRRVYTGSIVYADAEGTLNDWVEEGIGSLDRIYFNVYDSTSNFKSIITKIAQHFGATHGGIAEWSAGDSYDNLLSKGVTKQEYIQDIMDRAAFIKQSHLPAYLFTLRMDSEDYGWGFILADGTKRPGLGEFLNS